MRSTNPNYRNLANLYNMHNLLLTILCTNVYCNCNLLHVYIAYLLQCSNNLYWKNYILMKKISVHDLILYVFHP